MDREGLDKRKGVVNVRCIYTGHHSSPSVPFISNLDNSWPSAALVSFRLFRRSAEISVIWEFATCVLCFRRNAVACSLFRSSICSCLVLTRILSSEICSPSVCDSSSRSLNSAIRLFMSFRWVVAPSMACCVTSDSASKWRRSRRWHEYAWDRTVEEYSWRGRIVSRCVFKLGIWRDIGGTGSETMRSDTGGGGRWGFCEWPEGGSWTGIELEYHSFRLFASTPLMSTYRLGAVMDVDGSLERSRPNRSVNVLPCIPKWYGSHHQPPDCHVLASMRQGFYWSDRCWVIKRLWIAGLTY